MNFAERDGQKVAVLRPDDPDLAVQRGRSAVGKTATELDAVLCEQEYTLVGLLAAGRPYILDQDGRVLQRLRDGDSFIAAGPFENLARGTRVQFQQSDRGLAYRYSEPKGSA